MSLASSAVELDVALRPSARAVRYLLIVHSLLLLLAVLTLHSGWPLLLVIAALAFSWRYSRRHRAFGFGSAAVSRLQALENGQWRIAIPNGRHAHAELRDDTLVWPWVVVLQLKSERGRRHTRVLFGDELDDTSWRALHRQLQRCRSLRA